MIKLLNNIVGILGIIVIFTAAFILGSLFNLAPCPFCWMQRLALINIGIALFMNLRYGYHPAHWAMVILSALVGMSASMRQVLMHITDPIGFGDTILGIHVYSWCLLAFMTAIILSVLGLFISPQIKTAK
jgi:disulfide bond formation protein DsbB